MTLFFVITLLGFVGSAWGQVDCTNAPTSSLKTVCEQLHKWDKNVRETPPVTAESILSSVILEESEILEELGVSNQTDGNMTVGFPPIASNLYECMDLGCLCQFMGGNGKQGSNNCILPNGQPLRKAIRKEYRMMTDVERNRFHTALRKLKDSGEYDNIGIIHSEFAESGGAHSGPGFLPWHREFIKRMEIAIRYIDPTLGLPYWDSTLDSSLANPEDSILFSEELMGTTDDSGKVVTGFFADWKTFNGSLDIKRDVGANGSLFTGAEINFVMRQTQITQVLAATAPQKGCPVRADWNVLEYTHGNIHLFVGGDMVDQLTSANDPIFYIHHCFVDFIWELWRQWRQTRSDRENVFPPDLQNCSSSTHFRSALMRPFDPWKNVDGLSNLYTDNMYEYAFRPFCSATTECGSKYLFCDRSHGPPRCSSKIRIGTSCKGYKEENPCYNGVCQEGVCVSATNISTTTVSITTQIPPVSTTLSLATQPAKVVENCFNEHECCSTWQAQGECSKKPEYMNAWCKASCGKCLPAFDFKSECSDHHPNCTVWSNNGECTKNPYWMSENCRKSCNKCSLTRTQSCGRGGSLRQRKKPAQPAVRPAKCSSPGCYDENICCQFWSTQGYCTKNPFWMGCNCKVSCGKCIPQDYFHGSCDDYHKDCTPWAQRGECKRNPWMLQNCKLSCKTCLNKVELRKMCTGGRSRVRRDDNGNMIESSLFEMRDGMGMPGSEFV